MDEWWPVEYKGNRIFGVMAVVVAVVALLNVALNLANGPGVTQGAVLWGVLALGFGFRAVRNWSSHRGVARIDGKRLIVQEEGPWWWRQSLNGDLRVRVREVVEDGEDIVVTAMDWTSGPRQFFLLPEGEEEKRRILAAFPMELQ